MDSVAAKPVRDARCSAVTGASPARRSHQGCCNHQVCVARCTSEALLPYGIDGRVGIALAVGRCTGCGTCIEACPEQALSPRTAHDRTTSDYLVLTTHAPCTCLECAAPFVARGGEDLCPFCRKDRSLFSDLARGLRP